MNDLPLLVTVDEGLLISEDLNTIPRDNIMPPSIIADQQLCLTAERRQDLSNLTLGNLSNRLGLEVVESAVIFDGFQVLFTFDK